VGDVQWLGGGGLYRRNAIEQAGYLSNRNLHANEEKELGFRLTSLGWRLERIPVPAIMHYNHADTTFQLLSRRWRSHYSDGPGELLRAAWGKPYFFQVLKSEPKLVGISAGWVFLVLAVLALYWTPMPLAIGTAVVIGVLLASILRKHSAVKAILSMTNLSLQAAGLVRGVFSKQLDPTAPIEYRVLTPGAAPGGRLVVERPAGGSAATDVAGYSHSDVHAGEVLPNPNGY
jgi:hypothetical protein